MNMRVMIINLASVFAILALLSGLASALLAFTGAVDMDTYKLIFNLVSLLWFITAPLWFVPQIFGEGWREAGGMAWLRPKPKEDQTR
jgi:hypothetical protein